MSEALILAALAGVAVIAAVLSLIAWYLLTRRPERDTDPTRLDSGDPGV